ncbi:MAG TPA: hypothetical protein VL282_08215 [Tepidisphaeraceae bacterium]|jgi:hypothetical protein|nr:hypothetical protein [Tepidisphaeraceae bacterium]
MLNRFAGVALVGLFAGLIGCHEDRPHDYGEQRPPVDQLDPRDSGLQSKDVVAASDKMGMDILGGIPELNESPHRWTVVVDHIDNLSADSKQNYDIFLERVRSNLSRQGRGRVQLIENMAKFRELQSREIDPAGTSDFGEGGVKSKGVQPDYSLYGKIMEMPNRATSYFLIQFTLTNLHTGEQVWVNDYEVKVMR